MTNNAQITLVSGNTTIVFTPAEYKVTYESLASNNSGRTDDGTMVIDWKARQLVKIDITLPPYKVNDPVYMGIMSCIQGQEYTLKYYDYIVGGIVATAEPFYTSTVSGSFNTGVVYNGIVTGVSFQAIGMNSYFKGSSVPSHLVVTKLGTPQPTASSNVVTWPAITHGSDVIYYQVVDNGLYTTQSSTSYTATSGAHSIRVRALSDRSVLQESDWSVEVTIS